MTTKHEKHDPPTLEALRTLPEFYDKTGDAIIAQALAVFARIVFGEPAERTVDTSLSNHTGAMH